MGLGAGVVRVVGLTGPGAHGCGVASLAVGGLSDPRIGGRVHISRRTVQAHLCTRSPSSTSPPAPSSLPRYVLRRWYVADDPAPRAGLAHNGGR